MISDGDYDDERPTETSVGCPKCRAHYARSANLKTMAASAAELISVKAQGGNETVHFFPLIPLTCTNAHYAPARA